MGNSLRRSSREVTFMHAQVAIEIAAPPEVVWALVQSADLRPRWDSRIAHYWTEGSPPSAFGLVAKMGLLRPRASGRVLIWRSGRQSAIVVDRSDSMLLPRGAGSWTFDRTEHGTRFTSRFSFAEDAMPRLIPARWFLALFRYDTVRSFRRLKRLIESGVL